MTLRERLRERAGGHHVRLVMPEGDDPRIQAAARTLEALGIADVTLLTLTNAPDLEDPRTRAVAESLRARRPHVVRDGVHALELASDPLRFAAGLVGIGAMDGCVAGAVHPSGDVVRAALWAIGMRPGIGSVSAAMYHGFHDGRILTYTDVAVIPTPTPDAMADAASAAVQDRRALLGDEPVVAFLSFSTRGSASGAEVDRVRTGFERFRERYPDVRADGELQLDAALVPEVALCKCPASPVAGQANILVFPSLDAANIGYKLTERLAGATAAGPLLQGLARPMSDLSRGASTDDIVDVAAMVALQARDTSIRPVQEP
ncbi:MAG TPA: phosphate acyltransferase [Gemmatimonadales bacterium]|nr:phosphate acyltransferase [Gemmatimonadales bacterium]